ncbi:unnamed protein product, partial [Mesorhabditis spiculigera]
MPTYSQYDYTVFGLLWAVRIVQAISTVIRLYTTIVTTLPCLICGSLNLALIYFWRNLEFGAVKEKLRCWEGRQLIYSVLIVLSSLPMSIYQIIKIYATWVDADELLEDATEISDICYLGFEFGNAYILFFLNRDIRQEFVLRSSKIRACCPKAILFGAWGEIFLKH